MIKYTKGILHCLILTLLISIAKCDENKIEESPEEDERPAGFRYYYDIFREGIVPDVVDEIEKNVTGVYVRFNNVSAFLGNILSPYDTTEEPWIDWYTESGRKDFYTVLMVDPDSPNSRAPAWREWEHWTVVNIPDNIMERGEVLTEYMPPYPEKDMGIHRYIILLYKQPGKLHFTERYKHTGLLKSRRNFYARDFAKKYNLGIPVGGNFFRSQYETEQQREESLKKWRKGFAPRNITVDSVEVNTYRGRNWDYDALLAEFQEEENID